MSKNPRSTVGTVTEVHDYLRLLFARIGIAHCPNDGTPVERQTPQQIVDRVRERYGRIAQTSSSCCDSAGVSIRVTPCSTTPSRCAGASGW